MVPGPPLQRLLDQGRIPALTVSDGKWSIAGCCGRLRRAGSRWPYSVGGEAEQVLGGRGKHYGRRSTRPVAEKHGDIIVIDVETGTPRQWDIIQVMLYMYGLGRYATAWGYITLKWRVVYSDHVVDIPADAIGPEFIEDMGSLIRRVADEKPAVGGAE